MGRAYDSHTSRDGVGNLFILVKKKNHPRLPESDDLHIFDQFFFHQITGDYESDRLIRKCEGIAIEIRKKNRFFRILYIILYFYTILIS